jgi:hypothetical protein
VWLSFCINRTLNSQQTKRNPAVAKTARPAFLISAENHSALQIAE